MRRIETIASIGAIVALLAIGTGCGPEETGPGGTGGTTGSSTAGTTSGGTGTTGSTTTGGTTGGTATGSTTGGTGDTAMADTGVAPDTSAPDTGTADTAGGNGDGGTSGGNETYLALVTNSAIGADSSYTIAEFDGQNVTKRTETAFGDGSLSVEAYGNYVYVLAEKAGEVRIFDKTKGLQKVDEFSVGGSSSGNVPGSLARAPSTGMVVHELEDGVGYYDNGSSQGELDLTSLFSSVESLRVPEMTSMGKFVGVFVAGSRPGPQPGGDEWHFAAIDTSTQQLVDYDAAESGAQGLELSSGSERIRNIKEAQMLSNGDMLVAASNGRSNSDGGIYVLEGQQNGEFSLGTGRFVTETDIGGDMGRFAMIDDTKGVAAALSTSPLDSFAVYFDASGGSVQTQRLPEAATPSLAGLDVSPDGKFIWVGDNGQAMDDGQPKVEHGVRIFDAESLQLVTEFKPHADVTPSDMVVIVE